nr:hypothetical protein [Tanacetum cinerariifolium]
MDRLARSILIQGIPNDINSLIDSNKTAKDLWDALARQMLGSEYGEQDRKAAVLYEYETFKVTEGELFLDTYIRYLQVINDLKKCGYSKDNYELNFKFLNHLQPDKTKEMLMMLSDPLALIAEKRKVSKRKEKVIVSSDSKGSDEDDFSELKKIAALLEKAYNRKNFYSKPTNNNLKTPSASNSANKKQDDLDQEINANMVFMAQIQKVLSDSEDNSSSSDDKIAEMIKEFDKKIAKYKKRLEKANQQCNDFENQNKDLKDKYDVLKNQATTFEEKNNELNEQIKVLIEKNADLLAQTNV